MISAIIFDCDGVLVDSEFLALEIELSVLTEIGLHYELSDYKHRFLGLSVPAYFSALDIDAKQRGVSLPPDLRPRLESRYEEALAQRLVAVPGVHLALDHTRRPMAVASSSTARHLETKLKKVNLWERFAPHIYSADHVEHAKPAPDLFLHAAKQLGILPKHCLVIEDSIMGVQAAKAADMRVWGFVGGSHNDEDSSRRLEAAGVERVVENWTQAALLFPGL